MGRLFDAVASLCGVRHDVTYEGQAAIELEALVGGEPAIGFEIPIDECGVWHTDTLVRAVASEVLAGTDPRQIAARFHRSVADAIAHAARLARRDHGIAVVGLSGGVFQNVVLTEWVERHLRADGFEVLVHRIVPPNDGGIALGQAAVAITRASMG
jgi:hydrogenase maturation protein HypF